MKILDGHYDKVRRVFVLAPQDYDAMKRAMPGAGPLTFYGVPVERRGSVSAQPAPSAKPPQFEVRLIPPPTDAGLRTFGLVTQ